MKPHRRRLLIPGLLVVLIGIVAIASLVDRAGAARQPASRTVSTIDDLRITEASGMAVSRRFDDLAYLVNDSGSEPAVYAIRVATGDVVGVTTVDGATWRDTEAMALDDDGTLWVADTGDNAVRRDDVAVYALDEPGPGDRRATARRFAVSYSDGSRDVEAMVVANGRRYLISKGLSTGDVYVLPDQLSPSATNVGRRVGERIGGIVTDATSGPAGRALVRTYGDVIEVETGTWRTVRTIATPQVRQGETIAIEPGDRSFLIGSEGSPSPLIRVGLDEKPLATPTPTNPALSDQPPGGPPGGSAANNGFAWRTIVGGLLGVGVLVGMGAWAARR